MLYLEACIEKYYLKMLIVLFVIAWLYLYFLNRKDTDKITDRIDSWFPF